MDAIFHLLCTGAVPAPIFDPPSTVYDCFQEVGGGVFAQMSQAIDRAVTKAPLRGEATGPPNPTDRGKWE